MSDALKYAKEVLEAHEKKPEASLPGLLLLARAVVRQDEEIAATDIRHGSNRRLKRNETYCFHARTA